MIRYSGDTIWRLSDPRDFRFARAIGSGAWTAGTGLCPECTESRQRRAQPLVMEWQSGSDVIADFTWTGGAVVVTGEVFDALRARFSGFEAGPIQMVQAARLVRPKRPRVRRVWLPYDGPPLHELWVTTDVHFDRERSTVVLVRSCRTCGEERWRLRGSAERHSWWDRDRRQLVRRVTTREPNTGVYVSKRDLAGADVFRLHEFRGWVMCTDSVKRFVEEQGYTNVSFLEMGQTF